MLGPAGEHAALPDALGGGIQGDAVGGAPFVEIAVDGDAPVDGGDCPGGVPGSRRDLLPGAADQGRKDAEESGERPGHYPVPLSRIRDTAHSASASSTEMA